MRRRQLAFPFAFSGFGPGPLKRKGFRSVRAGVRSGFDRRRHPALDAPAAVNAIGLFSLGHSAAYRSHVADGRTIGVDVGGTKIAAGVIDREGRDRPPAGAADADRVPGGSARRAWTRRSRSCATTTWSRSASGFPSTIDQRSGRAISSVHIPLADLDFRDRMRERFSLPVGIDNDANAATLAEWQIGAGRGTRYMVMLTLGTGVGGGLVLDGKMYRGAVGAAAELGHMVLSYGGEPCGGTCEGHGHFEQFASGRAADRRREGDPGRGRRRRASSSRRRGRATTPRSRPCTRSAAGWAPASARLVNVFDPEVVVLGGGFSSALDLLLDSAREVVPRRPCHRGERPRGSSRPSSEGTPG